MPGPIHLIFRDSNSELDQLPGRFKSYSSKAVQKKIGLNNGESRRAWLQWMFEHAGFGNE